jgi:nicotinamidase-related amidase
LGSITLDGSDLTPIARERSESRRKITGYPTIFPITSNEYKVREEIKPQNNEIVLIKSTMGAFASTNIDSILHSLGIKNLIISGVMTNVCVESTGREAADHGYYCVIAEDSVTTWDQNMHDASLRSFSRFFGHVLSTDDLIKVIDASEKSI